jgi:hypothetical protein
MQLLAQSSLGFMVGLFPFLQVRGRFPVLHPDASFCLEWRKEVCGMCLTL